MAGRGPGLFFVRPTAFARAWLQTVLEHLLTNPEVPRRATDQACPPSGGSGGDVCPGKPSGWVVVMAIYPTLNGEEEDEK